MNNIKYNRVLLKLSGESLSRPGELGVDGKSVAEIAARLKPTIKTGVQMGIVIGAGNLMRGRHLTDAQNIHRTTADYMGMLGTVMNALALRDGLQHEGCDAVVVSAISMPLICDLYQRSRVMQHLADGKVVIFAGGTSHPGVTTDMCAAIRASDIDADALLKATKVDGVYDSDPHKNPAAKKFDTISCEQAIALKLGVMDLPAMAFCMERKIPIMVFNMNIDGNLEQAVRGNNVGTIVE